MPLKDAEWDVVRELVVAHLLLTPNPYQTLEQHFPNQVAGIGLGDVPDDNGRILVVLAKNSMAEADPFAIRLLEVLAADTTIRIAKPDRHAVIEAYLVRLRQERDLFARFDPFDARVLPASGEIFINRHTTRRLLRLLDTPEMNRPVPVVFQVVGEKQTGKSYTRSLINHLSASQRFEPVVVELDESSNARHIFDDLAVRVGGVENPDLVYSAHPGQHRFLANWLVTKAMSRPMGQPYWFVIDQCNEVDANSDAVKMVTQLAKAVQERYTEPRRPRLVLLGYDNQFPTLPIPTKQVSVDAIRRINHAELQEFFTAVFREHSPVPTSSDQVIRQYVDVAVNVVLENAEAAEANGDSYMDALRVAAEEAVDEYRR